MSGGGGTAPNPATGTVRVGKSIGAVGSPLRGHKVYRGSLGLVPDAWYQPDAEASGATIRVENTTVAGSPCATIRVNYDNADGSGGVIANPVQGDNSGVTFAVTAAGLYFIEINAFNCTATQATHLQRRTWSRARDGPSPPRPLPGLSSRAPRSAR